MLNTGCHRPPGSARLRIIPVSYRQACGFVAAHHRNHRPPQGHKSSTGKAATHGGCLAGAAVVGRRVARSPGDGYTAEVTRLANGGTPNACSALLRAAWRTAHSAGYARLVTYIHAGESGASLRGAGMRRAAERAQNTGWHRRSRPRKPTIGTERTSRIRWEITARGGRRAR